MYALQLEPETNKRWRLLLLGGLCGSAAFGGTLAFAAQIQPPPRSAENTVIQMVVVQSKKTAPPEPEVTKPEPPIKPEPKTPRRKPERAINRLPEVPPPAAETAAAPEPLLLGLTLSSTTQHAGGPKFGTGDSLLGEPDRVAHAPRPPRRGTQAAARTSTDLRGASAGRNSVSVAAKLSRGTTPAYPSLARSQGVEGVVVLVITIGPNGLVEDVRVIKGLGLGLDEAALAAARKTVWSPATVNGNPIRTTRPFNVRFTLQN